MMEETESGKRCRDYLFTLDETLNEDNLLFWQHKNLIKIRDEDTFHQLAQATSKATIREFDGILSYLIDIPVQGRETLDHWRVVLDGEPKDFLDKYGNHYQII